MAPVNCLSLLPDNWDQVGLDCSSLNIIEDAVELITESLCSINCELSRIAVTDDCALLPDQFSTLYPDCFEAPPDGALVIQVCSCNQGGLKIWGWDGVDWVRIAKELAIGVAGDFPTNGPSNPTAAELLALFGGHIADEAMVIVRPTSEIWTSQNCGITWQLLADVPPIGADVENIVWDQTYAATPDANYFLWFDETLYTNGDTNALTIESGDLIDLTVVYGYVIEEFADATNPVDNINFRFRLSGPFTQFDIEYGDPTGVAKIRNGINYAEFNYKIRATTTGNIRFRIYSTATGTLPTGAQDWEWTFYVARSSVSVQRVDFA